jgi:DNA invertase Pin-like site-specific DNA recombinase
VRQKRGTPKDIAAARRMRDAGKPVKEIARALGFHRTTITKWTHGRATRITPEEIAIARRMTRERKTIRQIQKQIGHSLYTISRYTRDIREPLLRICQNPECGKRYETFDPKSKYCNRNCKMRHRYLRTRKNGR